MYLFLKLPEYIYVEKPKIVRLFSRVTAACDILHMHVYGVFKTSYFVFHIRLNSARSVFMTYGIAVSTLLHYITVCKYKYVPCMYIQYTYIVKPPSNSISNVMAYTHIGTENPTIL